MPIVGTNCSEIARATNADRRFSQSLTRFASFFYPGTPSMTATRRRRRSKALTDSDLAIEASYHAEKPDALGNLHQRMKAVVERAREIGLSRIDNDLWQAIHDLQTEVSFYVPARPPFGRRSHRRSPS
jgi:hypothetical protein